MAQICYYDPQSAGINMQSPKSATTPRRLALVKFFSYLSWTGSWSHARRNIFDQKCPLKSGSKIKFCCLYFLVKFDGLAPSRSLRVNFGHNLMLNQTIFLIISYRHDTLDTNRTYRNDSTKAFKFII